jgi:hypothetical protein
LGGDRAVTRRVRNIDDYRELDLIASSANGHYLAAVRTQLGYVDG